MSAFNTGFVCVQVRHPGHLCGGDDRQGGSPALVPAQDCPLQERQRPELPPQEHVIWSHLDQLNKKREEC